MKLSDMQRDMNSVENGTWINGAYGNLNLKIASTDKKEYVEMLRKLMKPYSRNNAWKQIDDSKFENEIQNKCIAKHILLGWENLEDENGPVPYSEAKAYELLCNPEYREFRDLVVALAQEEEVFRKEAREELANKS